MNEASYLSETERKLGKSSKALTTEAWLVHPMHLPMDPYTHFPIAKWWRHECEFTP